MDKRIDTVEQARRRLFRLAQKIGMQDILREYQFVPMTNERLTGTGEKEKINEE